MLSLRIFKVLFSFIIFIPYIIYSPITSASDLTMNEARDFLESLARVKIQNQEISARWSQPIRVNLNFRGDKFLTKHVTEQLIRLDREVQGLSVFIESAQKEANFIIELLEEKEFSQKAQLLKMALGLEDNCASRIRILGKDIMEVHVLIKNKKPRQLLIRCAARSILQGLGVGDPTEEGILLINSMRGLYDRFAINLTDLDILVTNFAYADSEIQKDKYITEFQQKVPFDHYTLLHHQKIKIALLYLSQPYAGIIKVNNSISDILNIKNKTIAYSYISYFSHLFSLQNVNLNAGELSDSLLEDILKTCRNCYFSLLEERIKNNLVNKVTDSSSDMQKYISKYNPQADTILIRATAAMYKAVNNINQASTIDDIIEAQSIYKDYLGEESVQFVMAHHTLSMWYYFHQEYHNAAVILLENRKFYNGTILNPISEGLRLLDAVEVFIKAGMLDEAQSSLDAARSRFISARRTTELVQLEKVRKRYNLH